MDRPGLWCRASPSASAALALPLTLSDSLVILKVIMLSVSQAVGSERPLMLKTDGLLSEAMFLPVELRAQLADALLKSLNPARAEIDELWGAEAERRVAEIEAGRAKLIPGEQVFAKLRKRRGQ